MPVKLTQEQYINKANEVHDNKYSYSKTIYTKSHNKITITCPKHGDFIMKACSHTNSKQGCPVCAGNKPMTQKEFISKATYIHNNKYDYSKFTYTRSHDKSTIVCHDHGDFEQQAYVHLQGHGCPSCANEIRSQKNKDRPDIWTYRGWEEAASMSSKFEEFYIYIIKCWDMDTQEEFIKIGKSFMPINRRFSSTKAMPYEWNLITKIVGSSNFISRKEQELHKEYKKYSYSPTLSFAGSTECYTMEILNGLNLN